MNETAPIWELMGKAYKRSFPTKQLVKAYGRAARANALPKNQRRQCVVIMKTCAKMGIRHVRQLEEFSTKDFLDQKGFGRCALKELKAFAKYHGLKLKRA